MTLPENTARYLGLCSSFGHINGVQNTMTYLISRSPRGRAATPVGADLQGTSGRLFPGNFHQLHRFGSILRLHCRERLPDLAAALMVRQFKDWFEQSPRDLNINDPSFMST